MKTFDMFRFTVGFSALVALLAGQLGPFAWVGGGLILAAAVTLTLRGDSSNPEVLLE